MTWQNALTDKIFVQMIKTRKLIRILCLTVLFGPLFNAFPPHEMVCFVLTTIQKNSNDFLCFVLLIKTKFEIEGKRFTLIQWTTNKVYFFPLGYVLHRDGSIKNRLGILFCTMPSTGERASTNHAFINICESKGKT